MSSLITPAATEANTKRMVSFTVPGLPRPQGSSRAFVSNGKAHVTSSSPRLRPWREAIAYHAQQAGEPFACPVVVSCTFTFPPVKSAPKRKWVFVKPDLDKLFRAILDGLVEGGLLRDDALVVGIVGDKRYGDAPGARVVVLEASL